VAEHSTNVRHGILLSAKSRHMGRITGESIWIEFHPKNMNREDGICLNKSWKPLLYSLK
jgi:hypothetical protein